MLSRCEALGTTVHNFENALPSRIAFNMPESITNTIETRRVCQEINMLRVVEMPNNQVTGKNCLELVKLYLMFG